MSYRMIEAENIGVQAKATTWIITVTILDVSTHRMTHISSMNANLVLASCFQLILYQRMRSSSLQGMKMGNSILATIVSFAGKGNVRLVVLQPVGNRTFIFLHLSRNQCHVSAVVYIMVPVVFQGKFRLLILCVNHQARSISVKTVHHMSLTVLACLVEVIIQYALHIQSRVTGSHTENTHILLNDDKITILIDNLEITALEDILVLFGLKVLSKNADNTEATCEVLNNAMLGNKKGVNLPGVITNLPALSEKDRGDLVFGIEQDVDFIAVSFVRKKKDVEDVRSWLDQNGGQSVKIISKIENQEGLDNFEDILEASDGIMVARGDLGVEIPAQEVIFAQKKIIRRCNEVGKIVVTATQMPLMLRVPMLSTIQLFRFFQIP